MLLCVSRIDSNPAMNDVFCYYPKIPSPYHSCMLEQKYYRQPVVGELVRVVYSVVRSQDTWNDRPRRLYSEARLPRASVNPVLWVVHALHHSRSRSGRNRWQRLEWFQEKADVVTV